MYTIGYMPNGEPVTAAEIEGGNLKATILSYGSLLHSLQLTGHDAPLVLAYADFEDYLSHALYLGSNCGRSIGRTRGGRLVIDGEEFQLEKNSSGKHNLHGGTNGIGTRNWKFVSVSRDEAVLEIRCPDGNMGFPGNLDVRATYRLSQGSGLSVTLEAVTDRPTMCSLTHHSYFNLEDGGETSILDHNLKIHGGAYLPVDEDLVPDGRVVPVAGTDFDFRESRPIRHQRDGSQVIYDNNFCISAARGELRLAATAKARGSGVTMECWTTEPGLQFFAGDSMARPAVTPRGYPFSAYSGFCLEAQIWPNSAEYSYFPQAILRPGEVSTQVTEYRFSRATD
ncbi:MAG: aldose epimerase family protein [Devosia sp.]